MVDRVCYLGIDLSTGADVEIGEEEALAEAIRSVGAFAGPSLIQQIIYRDDSAISVKYFDVVDPPAIIDWHSRHFPTAVGQAWCSYVRNGTGAYRVGYTASPGKGSIGDQVIEQLDADNDIVSEERRTLDGRLIERLKYGYGDDKEIVETRVCNHDDVLIQADRHDLDVDRLY
ncbi:hypothetical protein ACIBCN_26510 [Nocardia sp. NPDC051052]|uniref:hypothetical protein n=1 Tax=Nocardia sp. NPDC051052 TaxID=3364322 RepID=UPI00378A3D7A